MGGVITGLVVQLKNKERVNVFVDGQFAFGLAAIEAVRLRKGQTLSDAEIDALRRRDQAHQAHERALRYLDYRPRSVNEIRRYLQEKDTPAEVIDEVVARLEGVGLLDDRAFARYWLENRKDFSPRGERALRLELRQKGIAREVIDEALSAGHREDDAAYRAARAQARKVRTPDRFEFRRKLGAYLARRGFSYDVAREAVDRVWNELNDTTLESEV